MREFGLNDLEIFDPDKSPKSRARKPTQKHHIDDTEQMDINDNEILIITEWDAYKELVAR